MNPMQIANTASKFKYSNHAHKDTQNGLGIPQIWFQLNICFPRGFVMKTKYRE